MNLFFIKIVLLAGIFGVVQCRPVREVELNKDWVLTNQNGSIRMDKISLPSGIFSVYAKNLSLPEDEILYSKNDVHLRWLARENWTYSNSFMVGNIDQIKYINLTLHGIDTIAIITLNGIELGRTNNMFVRYSYAVKSGLSFSDSILKEGVNNLNITIISPIYAAKSSAAIHSYTPPECPPVRYNGECHMNFLRKMQASFAWDWGLAAPSMGIWKSVTLEYHDIAIIRDVDVMTSKLPNGDWDLRMKIYLETEMTEPFYGELTFYAVELVEKPIKIIFNETRPILSPLIERTLTIDKKRVELWWPNGSGGQKLYHLHFSFNAWVTPDGSDPRQLTLSQKSIRIGFRTIELVQDEMENGNSFYFRVNDVPIFMKGTNYIPSHILPELGNNQQRIRHLLESVKEANMNMIRVWGGGVYESNYFYDMADTLGILIWQDMMFACAMYPVFPEFLESVREEVNQNIKRIAHHASIALIAGNNENEAALVQNWYGTGNDYNRFASEYRLLYNATINDEMRKFYDHASRPEPLTSSPSNGIKTIKDDFISKQPQDPNYGDIHFYDYAKDGWNPEIFPVPRFSSEYGFQSIPAMSSWKRVMGPHDTLEGLIEHRQHFPAGSIPIESLARRHFPLPIQDNPNYIEALIYFSQIGQAMATKIETEVYRKSRNTEQFTMGALYWQLNDVWIAPSWSSIDFHGNYKILHYWAKEFMAPLAIIAHPIYKGNVTEVEVIVVRDTHNEEVYNLTVTRNIYFYKDLVPIKTRSKQIKMKPNSVMLADTIYPENLLRRGLTKNNCFFEFQLQDEHNSVLSRTYYFPDVIKKGRGIMDPNIKIEIYSTIYKNPICSISIALKINHPAIFVYLEVIHENVTNYKLSKNGFIQVEPMQIIHLEFVNTSIADISNENIKVLTVNQFMN